MIFLLHSPIRIYSILLFFFFLLARILQTLDIRFWLINIWHFDKCKLPTEEKKELLKFIKVNRLTECVARQ